jgi:hypothetical protein
MMIVQASNVRKDSTFLFCFFPSRPERCAYIFELWLVLAAQVMSDKLKPALNKSNVLLRRKNNDNKSVTITKMIICSPGHTRNDVYETPLCDEWEQLRSAGTKYYMAFGDITRQCCEVNFVEPVGVTPLLKKKKRKNDSAGFFYRISSRLRGAAVQTKLAYYIIN